MKKILFFILLLPLLIQRQAAGQDVLDGVWIPDHSPKTVYYSADQILKKGKSIEVVDVYISAGEKHNFLVVIMAQKEDQSGFYIKKGDQYCWIVSEYQSAGNFIPYTIRQDARNPNSVELVYREKGSIRALRSEFIEIYDYSSGEVVSIIIKD